MLSKLILLLILVPLISSCNKEEKYVYYENIPPIQREDSAHLISEIYHDIKIDVLFVIDNSGSMGPIQKNIVKNAELFMQEFLKNNIMNWRMGIISTDESQDPFLGFDPVDISMSDWFDAQYATTMISQGKKNYVIKKFQGSVDSLGTDGDASEFVFYNILRFMLDPVDSKFFRRDAHLAVIMVTDEKAQSEDNFGTQYEVMNFLNTLRAFKKTNLVTRFYGAFSFKDLKGCTTWGDAYAGSPFEAIINETNGIHMSACTDDFGKDLAEIGRDIIRIVDNPRIMLKERPKVETLEVFYDGQKLKQGRRSDGGLWFYSKKYNTINFYNLDFVGELTEFSKIRIKYDINDGINRNE